jgi:glutamate-1-semialdehyde 2,1-aminomutase
MSGRLRTFDKIARKIRLQQIFLAHTDRREETCPGNRKTANPPWSKPMHDTLQKEIATYEKRTPKSAAAHKRALERIPLGVASNYRHYEPYPLFVKDGKGSRIHDLDGNEYIDHNLCFGALMAGHCHPAVVKAVEQKLHEGTTFGMPHDQEWELAEEICKRYPVDMVRFGSSGTEVTMHACRIARAAAGRDKIRGRLPRLA